MEQIFEMHCIGYGAWEHKTFTDLIQFAPEFHHIMKEKSFTVDTKYD